MSYMKAEDILPEELIRQLQEYVDGVSIYVPRREAMRKNWGESTGIREELKERDRAICQARRMGAPVAELAARFYLSEKSIHRILRSENRKG